MKSLGMINGKLMATMDPGLPFLLNVCQFRRKKIMGIVLEFSLIVRCHYEQG